MEEDSAEATIDFVPALCFLKRGIAKERPEKIVLTHSELAKIIKDAKSSLESEDEPDSDQDLDNDDNVNMDTNELNEERNAEDEYGFDEYENEAGIQGASIANVVDLENQLDDEDDSEAEDEVIKPTDNLLLVGHVSDDAASLEVWLFNEDEESLYTHHDFLLPSFPLCIEWLNHDPGSEEPGNICAIGCMDPIITLWDLDIQDSLEPILKLGSKGSRRKNKEKFGHTDAVLDLSWNQFFPHILASGSVDKSVILWDLDEGVPHTTITTFKEKVQSIAFHPVEAQSLLTGCADGKVRLLDCRDPDSIESNLVKWKVGGEVEKVLWNPVDTNYFIVGTNEGKLHYADMRQKSSFLWSVDGHNEEISGICFNWKVKNLLTTTATDGILKIWNFNESQIREVYSHDFKMGRLQCMSQCPEDPFTLAFGGEKPPRCRVYNIKNFEAVRSVFDITPEE